MNHHDKDVPFHLAGWVLFVICAFLFLYVAVRDSDLLMGLASLVFLAGCIAFLIPLIRKDKDAPPESRSVGPDRE